MLYIHNISTDPYFNLAAEEYLLMQKQADVFMLWQNNDTVVVGCNQNTAAEIDRDYVEQHHIAVVRRLTGGGAVFHDPGNLNFTFIQSDRSIDFAYFGGIIICALERLSLHAELSGRNDLTLDGRKFSGNACTVKGGRVLHHGTILLNTSVDHIQGSLRVTPGKIESKGIQSVRSRVTNINEHLAESIGIPELIGVISDHIRERMPDITPYTFTPEDIRAIDQLADEKYRTWEWNYGTSPAYNFVKTHKYPGGTIEARLQVNKGEITSVRLFGDFFGSRDVAEFELALYHVRHERAAIAALLKQQPLDAFFLGATIEDVLEVLL